VTKLERDPQEGPLDGYLDLGDGLVIDVEVAVSGVDVDAQILSRLEPVADERFCEAEIHRLKGELLIFAGEGAHVEACFQRALDVARAQGALSLELRAAASLARLWKDSGRAREARPLLADVYGRFSEGFDTTDLLDAKSLLDSL
jgi:predicted ATPase